ncbi:MAG: hypothetical protein K2X47_03025 [Bdellovibrionales bacterium]|nr:hypothetical protein [Bdellovibrionales bacterium]
MRFQPQFLLKDAAVYIGLPILAIFLYKGCENGSLPSKRKVTATREAPTNANGENQSQILVFGQNRTGNGSGHKYPRRSPGTLVRVKLLNVVETYSTAPVHVQIVDQALGSNLLGGTIIGDATPDTGFERINISFRFVRDPSDSSKGAQISARSLGLDGTLGLESRKKGGFFGRAVASSAQGTNQKTGNQDNHSDFKQILFKALTAGLIQEFGTTSQVEKNRGQVLTLSPPKEFYVELTDFFPNGS